VAVDEQGTVTVSFTLYGKKKNLEIAKRDYATKLAPPGTRSREDDRAESEADQPTSRTSVGSANALPRSRTRGKGKGSGAKDPNAPVLVHSKSRKKLGKKNSRASPMVAEVPEMPTVVSKADAEVVNVSAADVASGQVPLAAAPVDDNAVDYIDVLDVSQKLATFDPFSSAFVTASNIPPPSGGWRWRPAVIEETTGNVALVRYLDVDQLHGYPETGKINTDDNDRIAAYRSKSAPSVKLHEFEVGDPVDILDIFRRKGTTKLGRKWRKCQVVRTNGQYFIRVTFVGWSKAFDEWFHVLEQADRIAEFGSQTEKELRRREDVEANFVKCLRANKGLTVAATDPDGNCLFRAVAHQVYGDPERHDIVRADCCDYIEKNRERFEPLLETGQFDAYLEHKRKLKVWGDDPEVRAMEELYDRPVQIFVVSGDGSHTEPLKMHFEGDLPTDDEMGPFEPIRLSFHGDNHYNSIIPFVANSAGDDVSKDAFKAPPMRMDGVIRRHRRVKVNSQRESVVTGFALDTRDLDDDDEDESKDES